MSPAPTCCLLESDVVTCLVREPSRWPIVYRACLVKMVPTWLRYFDARPESFSIVETPLV